MIESSLRWFSHVTLLTETPKIIDQMKDSLINSTREALANYKQNHEKRPWSKYPLSKTWLLTKHNGVVWFIPQTSPRGKYFLFLIAVFFVAYTYFYLRFNVNLKTCVMGKVNSSRKTICIIYIISAIDKLTIRRFFSNNHIRVNVGMNYMTISTSTNSSFNAHQAVLLHHNKIKQFKEDCYIY